MTTPNALEDPHHSYGLGVAVGRPDGRTLVWGHGGSIPGYRTEVAFLPTSGTVIVVLLSTSDELDPTDLVQLLLRRRQGEGAGREPAIATMRGGG